MHKIIPFDFNINQSLRETYLEMLGGGVGRGSDKSIMKPVRHFQSWKDIAEYKAKDISQENIWVWSDLHFNHNNIIKYSNRPFQNIETMTEILIANFNTYVKPDDVSIWVGDIAFSNTQITNKILHRCNGYKILVVGNHDFDKKILKKMAFDETHIVYNLTVDSTILAFTHYPMIEVPDRYINIHGHQHISSTPIQSSKHINVNCEFHNYKPTNLQTIGDWISKKDV